MEARKWHEAESIELTEWTKRFSKRAGSLPPSAIKSIPGKSIDEVLFGTSTLRHSAVHRLPTSAAGILNMLSAAIVFVEALNDPKRAEKVTEIKAYLETSIEEIVQHQNLLERKLTDQCKDIARRRAELDELERSSIEDMLTTDKRQRAAVGFALESFLVRSQPCACSHAPNFDEVRADSEAEENMENGMGTFLCALSFRFKTFLFLSIFLTVPVEDEPNSPEKINEAQVYDRSPPSEEKSHQNKNLENDKGLPQHDNTGADLDDELEVSDSTLSTLIPKGKKKNRKKAAASGWSVTAIQEASVLVNEGPSLENGSSVLVHASPDTNPKWTQYGVWDFGGIGRVLAKPHNTTAERAIPAEEPCFATLEEISPSNEPYIGASKEELLSERAYSMEKAIFKEELVEMVEVITEAVPEVSQAELIIENFDDAEEHYPNQHDNIPGNLDESCKLTPCEPPCEPVPDADVASMHSPLAVDAELLVPSSRPAFCATRDEFDIPPSLPPRLVPPQPVPPSVTTSVSGAAGLEVTSGDSHTITLKILNGNQVFRAVVYVKAGTRTNIFNAAREYCMQRAQDDESLRTLLAKGCHFALNSLQIHGYDMDLSTYRAEDLSSLLRTIEKTDIPRLTLRISEI